MSTRILLTFSALLYATAGLLLLFTPASALSALSIPIPAANHLVAQLLGGAMLALALLNALSRRAPVGGIFRRPLVVANFAFLLITSLTLSRRVLDAPATHYPTLGIAVLSLLLTVIFGTLIFYTPTPPRAP